MAASPALQRFRQLRSAGKVRQGVNFKRYAARHGGFRRKYGLPAPPKPPLPPKMPPGQTPPTDPTHPDPTRPPAAPTPAPGAPPAAPPPPPAPWASDPILAQAQAAYQQAMSSQEAQAAARQQQLLTQYGDPALAQAILGQGSPYAQAAETNPFSTLAQLRYGYGQGQTALNENLNKANLFYSSTRGTELDRAARAYQEQLAGAAQEAQGGLASIAENLLGGRTEAEEMLRRAQEDAYERWLARALTGGGLPR